MAKTFLTAAVVFGMALGWGGAAESKAEEAPTVDRSALFPTEKEAEESAPGSFWSYWNERTSLGYGFDLEYNDNVLLEDNKKEDDLIGTLESAILLFDTRGSFHYGFNQEINAFRHFMSNRNAIDWDSAAFLDFDPGGLLKYGLTYKMNANNQLVRVDEPVSLLSRTVDTEETTDLFRRSNDFQRRVKQEGKAKASYSINKTDEWVNTVTFSVVDDQVQEDASSDRRLLSMTSAFEREFKPTWTFSTGYEFQKLDVPGNKTSGYISHLARFSLLHELAEEFELKGTFKYGTQNLHLGPSDAVASFEGDSSYPIPLHPRLKLILGYTNMQTASYSVATTLVRSQAVRLGFTYELSPIMTLTAQAGTSRSKSSGGTSSAATAQRTLTTGLGLKWQVTSKGAIALSHSYSRSDTRDTTVHRFTLGFESEL